MWKIASIAAVATAALLSTYSLASASVCPPGSPAGARIFTLVGTALPSTTEAGPQPLCHSYGPGNDFNSPTTVLGSPAIGDLTLIEKDELSSASGFLRVSGVGTTSGTWQIVGVTGFTDLVLVLKSGEGQSDPDWAAFLLNGATGGTWNIASPTTGQQSLSHASLYGVRCTDCPNPENPPVVPLPGPVWMFLATLASLGIYGWYRRRVTV